jgi:hypothetical protein
VATPVVRDQVVRDQVVRDQVVRDQVGRDQVGRDHGSAHRASASSPVASATSSSATATMTPPRVRSTPVVEAAVPTINVIAERWDDVVESLRTSRMLLAPFLEQAVPSAISSTGTLTVRADDVASADALESGTTDMLAVVRAMFPAVQRIVIARPETAAPSGPPRRVTEEEIRAQRIASLRKRDPVLGAAIDALDLELLD